ncbi:hypothetical protein ABIB75_008145 [Bradyrhizobium sp. GM2.2]
MNDAIVDAANKHFASDYFQSRQRFRDYVRKQSVKPQSIRRLPVGLVEENSQRMLRGLATDAPQR